MISVEYNGYASNSTWVPNPNQSETKLLKWDEGIELDDGKLTISSNGGTARILLAKSNTRAIEFYFVFVDGPSKTHQNLEGTYRIIAQLEGLAEKDGMIVDLDTPKFQIEFAFKHRSLLNPRVFKIRSSRTTPPPDGLPASRKKAAKKLSTHQVKESRNHARR